MDKTLITILLPTVGAIIGFWIKSILEKRKEYSNEIAKERREHYLKFVSLTVDIWKGVKVKGGKKTDTTKELFEFYKKYILYASPRVIKAFGEFMQFSYNGDTQKYPKKYFGLMTKVMYEMRRDLGLKNKSLGKDGINLMRALMTDFDKVLKH
jgi:hypothetical protein